MKNLICAYALLATTAFLFTVSNSAGADSKYQPREGHWQHTLVLQGDFGASRPLVMSSASFPATCAQGLLEFARRLEEVNGYVWTSPDFQIVSFQEQTGVAEVKAEVVEMRCDFQAFAKFR